MNGMSGFASIHFATKETATDEAHLANLAVAAWLLFVAMIFDMLDGRVARLTRRTSDFGAQLDSLSDVVSFGVAPAILMLRTVTLVLHGQIDRLGVLPAYLGVAGVERVVWCVAAAYLACSLLRLARFNVETDSDESNHMDFRGLPSPGAAATVAALVLLFIRLTDYTTGWRSSDLLLVTVGVALPVATMATALLMVSAFTYPHLVNHYIRGRRPFGFLVKLLAILMFVIFEPYIAAGVLTVTYTLMGPAHSLARRLRPGKPEPQE
jgi:CDP-diacylglycerol--serine O-phosphatidyltransferase